MFHFGPAMGCTAVLKKYAYSGIGWTAESKASRRIHGRLKPMLPTSVSICIQTCVYVVYAIQFLFTLSK